MNVMVFSGYLGSGKTLGASILALMYKEKSGCTLYSNYGLKGSKPFTSLEDFIDVAVQSSSIVCLDEAHSDLDSRSSNSNSVKFWTHIIFYLRKLRCTMFFTTPDIETLDNRVRSICNIYCHVSKDQENFYYDLFDMQSMRFLKRYVIKKEKAFKIASQIYKTNAMVMPVETPQDKNLFNDFIERLKIASEVYATGGGEGLDSVQAPPPECVGVN